MSSTGSTEPLLRDRALTSVRTRFPLLQQRSFPDQPLSLRSTMLSGTHQETRCTDPVFPMTTSPFSRISSYGRGQDSSSAQKQPMSSTIPVQPTQISPTAAEAQPLTPRPKHAPQSARGVPERSSMYKRSLVSSAARASASIGRKDHLLNELCVYLRAAGVASRGPTASILPVTWIEGRSLALQ